jgi:thiosulfate/3-mercaptopyruvate sulfurtransferase
VKTWAVFLTAVAGLPGLGLISPPALAARLGRRGTVILEVASARAPSFGIPGACRVDYRDTYAARNGLSFEMPGGAAIAAVLSGCGVTDRSRIVLYGAAVPLFAVTRVWATLRAFGLGSRTQVMNGGLASWRSDGLPVAPLRRRTGGRGGRLALAPGLIGIATLAQVAHAARSARRRFVLVDARPAALYLGRAAEGRERLGHIPGAISLPFSMLVSGPRLRPLTQLQRIFQAAGLRPGERLIVYCHSGQKATIDLLAARLLGYHASLFDGSWQAWSRDRALPVAR